MCVCLGGRFALLYLSYILRPRVDLSNVFNSNHLDGDVAKSTHNRRGDKEDQADPDIWRVDQILDPALFVLSG